MSLTPNDLQAIKQLVDKSIDDKVPPILRKEVPKIVEPMFEELNQLISGGFDETQAQLNELRTDVNEIRIDMDEAKHDIKYVKVAIHRLEARGTLRA